MTEELLTLAISYGLRVVGALVVLIVGMGIAKGARGMLRKALESRNADPTLVPFFSNLAYYLMLTFVVIAVLGLFGVQVTSIIAVLGAAAFAVGMALPVLDADGAGEFAGLGGLVRAAVGAG